MYECVCVCILYTHIETLYSSIVCQSKIWKQPGCSLIEEYSDANSLFYYEVEWSYEKNTLISMC